MRNRFVTISFPQTRDHIRTEEYHRNKLEEDKAKEAQQLAAIRTEDDEELKELHERVINQEREVSGLRTEMKRLQKAVWECKMNHK